MSEVLWRGVDFKRAAGEYFLNKMGKELIPPRHRPENQHAQALMGWCSANNVVVHHPWQASFYFLLDAFLTSTRSIPDVIQKCFGRDPKDREWFPTLPPDERERREKFQTEFKPMYLAFRTLPASKARNVTVHSTGTPPVKVALTGFWGGEYVGGPCDPIPATEFPKATSDALPEILWLGTQNQTPIEPRADHFTLSATQADGSVQSLPLFPECRSYLTHADELIQQARELDTKIHAGLHLSEPPG